LALTLGLHYLFRPLSAGIPTRNLLSFFVAF
jgi:hypothetical protein